MLNEKRAKKAIISTRRTKGKHSETWEEKTPTRVDSQYFAQGSP